MPFYEYRRPDGTVLEVMQKMTDPPLTEDPDTGVPLQRIFHPIAVHFKGKGFYNTDYGTKKRARENAETKASEKKSDDAKKSDASSSSSGESSSSGDGSKPAQKAETPKSESKSSAGATSSPKSEKT